ncbi:ABC transporter permease [Tumebacillus lipolyticus]|uniref:ABC transporter permease n=1 Tax=Tumebacillus lipolyticus TaxID=1280370 RepID=A0ABW5A238_9BACL
MLSYILKSAKKSSRTFLTSIILLALLLASIPVSVSSLQTTKMTTDQSIASFARGSYDILVRPDQSQNIEEKSDAKVEENYLTGGMGGISLEDNEKIKQISGVEIAAPVSVLGFFTNDTGSVEVELPSSLWDSPALTTIKIFKENGLPLSNNDIDTTQLLTLPNERPSFYASRSMGMEVGPNETIKKVGFSLPQTYNLLVGVDPEEEKALLAYENYKLPPLPKNLPYGKEADGSNLLQLPLLVNESLSPELKAHVETRISSIAPKELSKRLSGLQSTEMMGSLLPDVLIEKPSQTQEWNLGKVQPFQTAFIAVSKNGEISRKTNGVNFFLKTSSYFITDRLKYTKSDQVDKYTLNPFVKDRKTYYRELIQKGKDDAKLPGELMFKPNIIGTYQASQITAKNLNPSPLGIYSFSPVNWSDQAITSGTSPNTFLPVPASALTNLEAAVFLKGDKPIDAIRVRVSDIEIYDSVAESKIFQISKEIQRITGLHTDIVAGASKQHVLVEIPEVSNYPALGDVEETWTTLGIATLIVNAVNQLSIWITIALFIIVIVYTVVHTQTQFLVRQKEFNLLRMIGWKKQEIQKLVFLEWCTKVGVALIPALVISFLFKDWSGIGEFWGFTILIQILMVLLQLLTAWVLISRLLNHKLRLGQEGGQKHSNIKPRSMFTMILGNLMSQLPYNVWTVFLILSSGTVAIFTLNMTLAQQNHVGTTFLGMEVNAVANVYQWVVVISALSMTCYGVWEATRSLLWKRRQEVYILRIIGWEKKHVSILILGELFLLLGIGVVTAVGIGWLSFRLFYEQFPVPVLTQGGILLLVIVLLMYVSSRLINKFTSKVV